MAGGCAGSGDACLEYTGPYLRLQQHDVNFAFYYMKITKTSVGGGDLGISLPTLVSRFPVGVLKDERVWTYYAAAGIAKTTGIPFKIFFGGSDTSDAPYLVAVAAARPFGSRIGPFINDACDDMFKTNLACNVNGRDPRYPTETNTFFTQPNFSVSEKDALNLGVKLTVDEKEYSKPITGTLATTNTLNRVDVFAKTYGKLSRNRYYVRTGTKNRDDGFDTSPTAEADYYDNDNNPVPPRGNRNSIFAWSNNATTTAPAANKRNSFEGYFETFANNKIISSLSDSTTGARSYNGDDYKVYVFNYPFYGPQTGTTQGGNWDLAGLTVAQTPYENGMERAFANTMAVSEFEIKRYIIPYSDAPLQKYLNNITNSSNKKAFIYAGETLRGSGQPGYGSKPFSDSTGGDSYAKKETNDVLAPGDDIAFPESYTAWRIGSRGYRVKLVNIQDLIKNSKDGANALTNPLPDTVTLPTDDEDIVINLAEVYY
jgi:hypothetical protein